MSEPQESAVPPRPVLRVVAGDPTAEELAALVAVVAARGAGRADPAPRPRSAWNDPARLVRRPIAAGPAGWR
ncbi:MAG: acyl-CoA carboxylase epsilon subunit, partial [Actinomycetes bacterium]